MPAGLSGTIGSLTGSGTVTNFNATTAGTVVTGLDNTSTHLLRGDGQSVRSPVS